jgi:hypothetical protein
MSWCLAQSQTIAVFQDPFKYCHVLGLLCREYVSVNRQTAHLQLVTANKAFSHSSTHFIVHYTVSRVFISPLVTASNGGRSLSSGFPYRL